MRLYPIDDPQHSEVADLLPWFANGTLDEEERVRVERHLADCIACKQDLVGLRNVQTMYADEALDVAASEGLARLQGRIEQIEASRGPRQRLRSAGVQLRRAWHWWGAVLVTQAVIIVALAAAYLNRSEPQYYHTLAATRAPAQTSAALVVVFAADRTEGEIRDLLRSLHARIADGPTAEGAYTLEVAAGERQRVLAELRQRAWVQFAEPSAGPDTP
jgi:anti-sigma-K factor RskA